MRHDAHQRHQKKTEMDATTVAVKGRNDTASASAAKSTFDACSRTALAPCSIKDRTRSARKTFRDQSLGIREQCI
jgi:hypothetical protein